MILLLYLLACGLLIIGLWQFFTGQKHTVHCIMVSNWLCLMANCLCLMANGPVFHLILVLFLMLTSCLMAYERGFAAAIN